MFKTYKKTANQDIRLEYDKILLLQQGTHLFKTVNHEEYVGIADLWLLSFTVHWVFARRRKHLLKKIRGGKNQTKQTSSQLNVLRNGHKTSNTKTAQSNAAQSANIFTYTRDAGHPAGKAELISDYSLFCRNDNTCEILEFSDASYQILVAPQ